MDGADVCRTSSRASRRPPYVISTVAILDSRWWCRKWRHPEPGASFSTPIAAAAQDGGPSASGRHLGWPHSGNEVIQDGDRKRKGRHLAPPPQWGSKNSPYTTYRLIWRQWTTKMFVRYMLPSECLRLRQFSQLSFIQYMGLYVFNLPNSPVMIVKMCTLFDYHHQTGSMNH